jgi:redox-regulated HSP33 family molecular chaperone
MSIPISERRQIENEMIFRRRNEKVGDDLEALDAMHIEDGHFDLIQDENLVLHFRCECSDENCNVRIQMLLKEYQEIHINRDTFIVIPDHQVDPIEKVLRKTLTFNVVKKNNSISEPADDLNITTINNS